MHLETNSALSPMRGHCEMALLTVDGGMIDRLRIWRDVIGQAIDLSRRAV